MSETNVTCLCGAVRTTIPLKLPVSAELCHCNPCRYTTGALYIAFTILESPPDADVLQKCSSYASSKVLDRYFCPQCGTKLFLHIHSKLEKELWMVLGGAIDPPQGADNVLNVEMNEFVTDTMDGGMAPFLMELGGRDVPCYQEGESGKKQLSTTDLKEMMEVPEFLPPPGPGDLLKAECHCGGVSLRIKRADHTDHTVSKLDRFKPKEEDKYMAFCCTCRFCRLATGNSLTPFVYLPPACVINPHTNMSVAQHHDASTGEGQWANRGLKLKHYWSSPGSCRSFCGECGASIFYSVDTRQEILNISAGLLRAEEGAMARRWLSWQWGRTAWKDEATDREIVEAWRATADS